MSTSKSEIDRIGNNIRQNSKSLQFQDILELQNHRTKHQIPLSKIFNILCELTSNNKKSTTIATYRLKRFESIINKLERYPKMRLSRMWDIGGCRIILENEKEVEILLKKIENDDRIYIKKINDYNAEISEDGYKSIHIYAELNGSDFPIEIQLRTIEQHNWATLVEITDVIFKTRIKELGKENNEELFKFHQLLSDKNKLISDERFFIYKILKKYKFLENLSEIFSKNYINVRKQWYNHQQNSFQQYFLIEVDINNKTKLTSFKNFKDAEDTYFELYNNTKDVNAVLTYQYYEDFKLLTTAYANYILTYHSFLKESLEILQSLIADSIFTSNYFRAFKIYNYYNDLILKFMKTTIDEIEEAIKINNSNSNKFTRKRHSEWIKDITKQLKVIQTNVNNLNYHMSKIKLNNKFYQILFVYLVKQTNKKYRIKLAKIIENSEIFKNYLDIK